MKETKQISVVLPTFNGSRYLDQAIDSVLAQTHESWELIIVDDASTDATPEIARRYAERDARIRVVRNAQNQRLPRSLNIGFREARGEFLTWTSDDNLYRPDAISEMVAVLESQPDVGLVYARMTVIDAHGQCVRPFPHHGPESLLHCNPIGACFLYRRSAYDQTGEYDGRVTLAEDYDYWLRISIRFNIRALEKDLYLYRKHAESLSGRNQVERIVLAADAALERALPSLSWASRRARFNAYHMLAKRAWRRQDYAAAVRAFVKSTCASPADAWVRFGGGMARKCWRGAKQ